RSCLRAPSPFWGWRDWPAAAAAKRVSEGGKEKESPSAVERPPTLFLFGIDFCSMAHPAIYTENVCTKIEVFIGALVV
ncbi:MAG: hypothetical protein ACKO4V_06780, partial [Planctomycetota bacterium]